MEIFKFTEEFTNSEKVMTIEGGLKSVELAKNFVSALGESEALRKNIIKILKIYATRNWTSKSTGTIMFGNQSLKLGDFFRRCTQKFKIKGEEFELTPPKMYKFALMGGITVGELKGTTNSPSGATIRYSFMDKKFGDREKEFEIEFIYALNKDIDNLTEVNQANLQAKKLVFMEKGSFGSNEISNKVIKRNDPLKDKINLVLNAKTMIAARKLFMSEEYKKMGGTKVM